MTRFLGNRGNIWQHRMRMSTGGSCDLPSKSVFKDGSSEAIFRDNLKNFCEEGGFQFSEMYNHSLPQLRISFGEFPMWFRFDVDSEDKSAICVGVVRTFGFPGDRSDYHELISLWWAALLRSDLACSCRLIDIPHPVVPGELYGRYLLFDSQPAASFISTEDPDYEAIKLLVKRSAFVAWMFSTFYRGLNGDPEIESCDDGQVWAKQVTSTLNCKRSDDNELTNERKHPDWEFYSRPNQGLSAFRFPLNPTLFFEPSKTASKEIFLEGPNAYLAKSDSLRNAINKKTFKKARKLLKIYGVSLAQPASRWAKDQFVFLPIESHLICVTRDGLLAIRSECGLDEYLKEEDSLSQRHRDESDLLHSSHRFMWSRSINDDKFEELIRDLLDREPGVRRVRRVGGARASDAGRDLIVEWWTAPTDWEAASEHQALIRRQVIVQCKAFKTAVNRSKIGDLVGTVDLHSADGYLLVAFPRVTPGAIDYLTKVPAKRRVWAEWWTQPEIEDRLRRNLDIAARYPEVVTVAK